MPNAAYSAPASSGKGTPILRTPGLLAVPAMTPGAGPDDAATCPGATPPAPPTVGAAALPADGTAKFAPAVGPEPVAADPVELLPAVPSPLDTSPGAEAPGTDTVVPHAAHSASATATAAKALRVGLFPDVNDI